MFKTHFQRITEAIISSCCCCYLECRWNCLWPPSGPLHLLPLLHPSLPGSRRSDLSASSCGPWCSAFSSSSSARRQRWPYGFSAWLHTPASAACSSCVVLVCDGRVWSHSPCGKADASARSGVRVCPGLCGGAVPGSLDTDTG